MNEPAVAIHEKESAQELFQSLLVAYDASEASETALQYAISLARIFNSLVTVAYIQSPSEFSDAMVDGLTHLKESHHEIAEQLQSIAQGLNSKGIRNQVMQRAGTVADVLVQLAAESGTDLLLLGAQGHRKDLPRLGSTAEFMLRSMPCAVLTVGPEAVLHNRGVGEIHMLLCASSLPPKAGTAAEFVKAFAKSLKAGVEIIHGVGSGSTAQNAPARTGADEAAAEKLCERLQAAGVPATWRFVHGLDGERISERAREIHAGLILFGIEHHPADPGVMGMISTAIRSAECPVLTIPRPA